MPTFLLKFMPKAILLLSAILMEIYSMLLVMAEALGIAELGMVLLMHFAACTLAAWVFPSFLAASYLKPKLPGFVFFFVVTLFMPLLGMLGLALSLMPGLRTISKPSEIAIKANPIRKFSDGPISPGSFGYGQVSLENLLQSRNPEIRLNAVYATLKLEDKNAIPLLRIALRDPVDDIRLLAYALIDRKEQRISERIESAKNSLEACGAVSCRHLYRSIVKDYWEIAHLGLAEGETLNYVLDKTREYTELGLQKYPDDRGLHFQYAKLLLKTKNIQAAREQFNIAESLGVERKQLLFYYAEIEFLQRRFVEVKRYMKEADYSMAHPQTGAVKDFWAYGGVH